MSHKYAVLVPDSQGNVVAVGPFTTHDAAERWEEKNPQHGEDSQGIVRLVKPSGEIG